MARKQSDDKIIQEMEDRKKEGEDLWSPIHAEFRAMYRFVNAKEGQFTEDERNRMGEPCVQENRLLSFLNYIINGAVKQDIGCDVEPVSEGANDKLARVRQAQVMKIWDMGKGKQAAAMALRHAVSGGFGVITQEIAYADNSTFNKTIKYKALKDPTTFICDPSAREPAMADMKWALIEDHVSKASYEKQFGEWEDLKGKDKEKWEIGDKKLVYQYWRIIKAGTTMYSATDGKSYKQDELESWDETEKGPKPDLGDEPMSRTVSEDTVEQLIITNKKIKKRITFPGCRLPYKVIEGREYWLEGKKTLQSMALHAMGPQKALNFVKSQQTAMWSKGPMEIVFIAAEGDSAGITAKITEAARNGSKNVIAIPYKSLDAQGNRLNPPTFKPQIMGDPMLTQEAEYQVSAIEAVIGITKGALMARPADASGVAIHASEEQGETTNYDYIENWLIGLEELFRDTLYIIPRLGISMQIKLAGDDQRDQTIWVNNQAAALRMGMQNHDLDEDEEYSLNLKVGPAPKSMRDKAFLQMNDYSKRHPELAPLIGDLDARASLDNRYADDIAARAHSQIAHMAPWVLDSNQANPQTMALQQQLQMAQQQMQQMGQAMQQMQQEAQAKLQGLTAQLQGLKADKSNEARRIELEAAIKQQAEETAKYEAFTNRLKVEQAPALKVLSPASLLTQSEGGQMQKGTQNGASVGNTPGSTAIQGG